jgi:hypothetical protein
MSEAKEDEVDPVGTASGGVQEKSEIRSLRESEYACIGSASTRSPNLTSSISEHGGRMEVGSKTSGYLGERAFIMEGTRRRVD